MTEFMETLMDLRCYGPLSLPLIRYSTTLLTITSQNTDQTS